MTSRILILADDLTGAADSAAAFVDRGATVALDTHESVHDRIVVAFDLHTRAHTPEAARDATLQAVHAIAPRADDVLFKKVDSALRGNVAHELAATLAWRRSTSTRGERVFAILAPAFPAHHRITRGGCQLHQEQPLHSSGLWHGERKLPPLTITELLAEAGLSSACIPLHRIRGEESALLAERMSAAGPMPDVFICDAETDGDLRAIINGAMHLGTQPILAGSAGLARQLASLPASAPQVSITRPGLSGGRY